MPKLTLLADGQVYNNWDSVEIERSLDQFAHRYSLQTFVPFDAEWTLEQGMTCTLAYGTEVLVSGYTNRVRYLASDNRFLIAVEGRSKTAELVDCSATHKTGSWNQKTATEIIRDLINPYSIGVSAGEVDLNDTEKFSRFAIMEGETVFSAIDRACKTRGLLPLTTPEGDIELWGTFEGQTPIALSAKHVIGAELYLEDANRYSDYLVRATGIGSAVDARVKAQATDESITRFRPLVVVGDAAAGTAAAKTRAVWESTVRAGRSQRLRLTMIGATNSEGETYQPGQIYAVRYEPFGIDDALLLERAVLRLSSRELVTDLELCPATAYSQAERADINITALTKRGKAIRKKTARGT
jgi:prophage tail gpP-like protein